MAQEYEQYIFRNIKLAAGFIVIVIIVALGTMIFKSIPAGHVGVATFFGKVQDFVKKS